MSHNNDIIGQYCIGLDNLSPSLEILKVHKEVEIEDLGHSSLPTMEKDKTASEIYEKLADELETEEETDTETDSEANSDDETNCEDSSGGWHLFWTVSHP